MSAAVELELVTELDLCSDDCDLSGPCSPCTPTITISLAEYVELRLNTRRLAAIIDATRIIAHAGTGIDAGLRALAAALG